MAAPLPTGTVTYLFTDIEGSTRLVQALGDGYRDLLDQHSRIIRDAIAQGAGREVGTEGDSFFAVFPTAAGAVTATVAAQRALAAARWPAGAEVRVRMGLHTGEASLGGQNYIGLDVHRAARIAAAGHGGQIVLSEATRSLLASALAEGLRLRDLGAHRLKDLASAEHLYQVEADGLSADFPALRSLDARPNNLPVQLTSFVGREAELAAVGELLERVHLVTLTGPGGTGKTRLAIQVGAERLARFGDGVFFVELAPITDPELVAPAIAAAIGVREAPDRPIRSSVGDWLRDREVLLILDNFEQVLDAAAVVADLLSQASRARALVTSRALLHVRGEREFPVEPLRIPDPAHLPALESLSEFEGVALFIERAMAARTDFEVTAANAPAIAEIVARLDGLPLALELAAAKVRLLGPDAILGRLGSRLAFLGGGARDLPARQQTLRQAIDWSYELLDPDEQRRLRRLGVFVGGFGVESAAVVAGGNGDGAHVDRAQPGMGPGDGAGDVEVLAALLDQSLIRRDDAQPGEPRFAMLETIREYALERLEASGELAATRRRHALHILDHVERLQTDPVHSGSGPEPAGSGEAIDAIARDHDNVRAALAWAVETGDADVGLRLMYGVWRFWQQRGHLREGREWCNRVLALPAAAAATPARAKGLTAAGGVAYWQNDYAAAMAAYGEAEAIIRGLDDPVWLADAIYNTGTTAALVGDMPTVDSKLAEGTAIARRIRDDLLLGKFLQAEGYMAFMTDDLARARPLLEEGLAIAERRADPFTTAVANHTVAQVARLQGRLPDAARHYREAFRIGREQGDEAGVTEPLQGLAAVLISEGHAEEGVRLLAANAAIRERLGGGPPPEWLRLGDPFSTARAALGDEAYERAWAAGLALTIEEVGEEVLRPRIGADAATTLPAEPVRA